MTQRILVPVDGSEQSLSALEYAIERFPDASVTAVHVLEVGGGDIATFSAMTGDPPGEAEAEERARSVFESVDDVASAHDVDVATERMRGRPDRAIVGRAEDDVDLIVMGSHGREGVARVLLGSVAEKVVRRASVPVLVVR